MAGFSAQPSSGRGRSEGPVSALSAKCCAFHEGRLWAQSPHSLRPSPMTAMRDKTFVRHKITRNWRVLESSFSQKDPYHFSPFDA